MSNTVIINGKTYTERTIDYIVVDGTTISGNLIPEGFAKEGELLTLNINVKSIENEVSTKASSSEENVNMETENIDDKDIEETIKKETWRNKLIKSMIKFLDKFIR